MNNTSAWKNFKSTITAPIDPWLFFAMLAIYIMSLFLLYSADGQEFGQLENKTIHTVLGFALLWIIAVFKPQTAAKVALPVYIVGVLLLIGVEVAGVTVNGSTRWLSLGFTRIQPSEIMKIGIPMTVAWYFQRYEGRLKWIHYIVALVLILVPVALILKQPDLGTAALIMASGIFVIFFAGLPWKAIFSAIIAFVAALPLLWNYGMHDYQKTRVLTLLDPTKDPLGAGYHIIQSMIAIGSGGLHGKGFMQGTQTHLEFIPERTTDFIFAAFSEEFGLAGNLLLIFGFWCLVLRALALSAVAPTLFSRLLAAAVSTIFFAYAFVNIGMVSGVLPVVGVPLPFISYGGTAMVTLGVALGILMSVSRARWLAERQRKALLA